MQALFPKDVYERAKSLSYELAKSHASRAHGLVEEHGYRSRKEIVFPAKDADLGESKEVLAALEQNKGACIFSLVSGEVSEAFAATGLAAIFARVPATTQLRIKDVAMDAFALQAMAGSLTKLKLQSIWMKRVRFPSQRVFEHLGAIIIQSKLQEVTLRDVGMTDYGLAFLADPIAKAESLKRLDLSYNPITRVGLRCIEDALKENDHLEYLGLRQKRAAAAYYEYVKGLKSLIKAIDFDAF